MVSDQSIRRSNTWSRLNKKIKLPAEIPDKELFNFSVELYAESADFHWLQTGDVWRLPGGVQLVVFMQESETGAQDWTELKRREKVVQMDLEQENKPEKESLKQWRLGHIHCNVHVCVCVCVHLLVRGPCACRCRIRGGATVESFPVEEQSHFLWWTSCFLLNTSQHSFLFSQHAPQQRFSNRDAVIWHQQMMNQVYFTCWSSIILRFSRWMSHGSDERNGLNGRSFGSWFSLGATMVIGGWERKSELRWASRDKCSTEAPPTSCQRTKLESEIKSAATHRIKKKNIWYMRVIKMIQIIQHVWLISVSGFRCEIMNKTSNEHRSVSVWTLVVLPEPLPSGPPAAVGTDSPSACCR